MILRLSDSLSRGLVVVVTLFIGVSLSYFGTRTAIGRFGADGTSAKRLELATRMEPGDPEYWHLLGRFQQYNLEEPDPDAARECYRKAVALNPLATDVWLDLGTSYELEGNPAAAREAYLKAYKSYPTSADVSWRYGNFLLRQGEQRAAYAELRRAIEADPRRAAAAFSRAYRANPDIDEILAELLPAKQNVYVDVIAEAANEKQLAVAKTVWAELLKIHPRLEIRDVELLVSNLLSAGEFHEARRVWEQGAATMDLPPLFQPLGTVVWDPSFESGINGPTFAWRFEPIAQGVSIGFDQAEKLSGNQSLRLSFDGKHNPNLEAACTLSIVQPATSYLFSAWIKTKDITTENGVGFRLQSPENSKQPVFNTHEFHGTNAWTLVQQSWTAGPNTHGVRVCATRDPSDNPEVRISGHAWIDDVNLVPLYPEHRKP